MSSFFIKLFLQLIIEQLDLQSMKSIRDFVQRVCQPGRKVDFLINNAGLISYTFALTEDGFESTMGTNHLGHFLLTELMLPSIKAAGPGARIICVSSIGHRFAKVRLKERSA